jgi:hypothetical protein
LSPIVTAGLPTPGPLDAGAGVELLALGALELLDDEVVLLLPQAARPTTRAHAAEPLRIKPLNLLNLLPFIRRLLLVWS